MKRGDFLIVDIGEAGKEEAVRYMVAFVLRKEQVKHLRTRDLWPAGFNPAAAEAAAAGDDGAAAAAGGGAASADGDGLGAAGAAAAGDGDDDLRHRLDHQYRPSL